MRIFRIYVGALDRAEIRHRFSRLTAPQPGWLLGVDLATVRELAAGVEPYVRADGRKVWSLMLLERQLRPERFGRRRGGYLDRRRRAAGPDASGASRDMLGGQRGPRRREGTGG
jgi:hypothetical protein